jgi:GT2 family glycosyltransferase
MTLPIYVIHWNDPDRLLMTVEGLTDSEGVDVEICVIDNASRQDAIDSISEGLSDGVRILLLPVNIGFAGAANEAIALACDSGSPWFVIASHDVVLRPRTLAELVACMQADPAIGIVGPLLTNADGIPLTPEKERWLGEVPEGDRQIGGSDRFLERLWVSGCLVLIRTEVVREVGGFWSELFAYSEDVDFSLRARDAGWRVGVGLRARACERGSTASVERRTYLNTRNGLAITRRRLGGVVFLLRSVSTALKCTRALVGSIAFWRRPERRDLSRRFFWARVWGVVDAFRGRLGPGRDFPSLTREVD